MSSGIARRRGEQLLARAEHVAARVRDPERRVAELLELRRRVARGPAVVAVAQLSAPHAHSAVPHDPESYRISLWTACTSSSRSPRPGSPTRNSTSGTTRIWTRSCRSRASGRRAASSSSRWSATVRCRTGSSACTRSTATRARRSPSSSGPAWARATPTATSKTRDEGELPLPGLVGRRRVRVLELPTAGRAPWTSGLTARSSWSPGRRPASAARRRWRSRARARRWRWSTATPKDSPRRARRSAAARPCTSST